MPTLKILVDESVADLPFYKNWNTVALDRISIRAEQIITPEQATFDPETRIISINLEDICIKAEYGIKSVFSNDQLFKFTYHN